MKSVSFGPTLRLRVLLGCEIALGPGKADLLEGIRETGSIAAAGRRLGMSYKRAWMLLDTMNGCFSKPLVEAVKGGKSGGGASLTAAWRRSALPLSAHGEGNRARRRRRSVKVEAGHAQGA